MNALTVRKSFLLFLIFIIFVITSITFCLTIFYVDPYIHLYMAVPVLIFSFLGSSTTFFTLLIYFFKTTYFRGEVYMFHILESFRQWFLLASFIFWIGAFYSMKTLTASTVLLFWMMLLLVELFIQNLYKKY